MIDRFGTLLRGVGAQSRKNLPLRTGDWKHPAEGRRTDPTMRWRSARKIESDQNAFEYWRQGRGTAGDER